MCAVDHDLSFSSIPNESKYIGSAGHCQAIRANATNLHAKYEEKKAKWPEDANATHRMLVNKVRSCFFSVFVATYAGVPAGCQVRIRVNEKLRSIMKFHRYYDGAEEGDRH